MNIRIGKISKILTPSYSCCEKCNTTWVFVKYHNTMYTNSRGMFPMCEKCWCELIPEQRLPFYRSVFLRWNNDGSLDFEVIKKAVLDGK